MLRNILKTTFRNLIQNKLFTALNIIGLTVGMAAFLMIIRFVVWEKSYDEFHEDASQIYRVDFQYFKNENEMTVHSATNFPKVAPSMAAEFPGVQSACRIFSRAGCMVKIKDKSFEEEWMFYADPSFLDIFSYELTKGDRHTCLDDISSVILEEKTAVKYFGSDEPMGKTIKVMSGNREENYVVTGIIRSPANSHFTFNAIFSFASFQAGVDPNMDTHWSWYDFVTYIKLSKGVNAADLETKFPAFIDKHGNGRLRSDHVRFELQPMVDIHLKSKVLYELGTNGNDDLVNFMAIIACFIILIAWINYVNLSTANSLKRSREIGIRKTLGSNKLTLQAQFFLEAVLINGFSILLAVGLFYISIPQFQKFTDNYIEDALFTTTSFWVFLVGIWGIGSIFSGFYPAVVLSNLKPLNAIKLERAEKAVKFSVRNLLVIFQFSVSMLLIAGAIVIMSQVSFMTRQELGIDVKHKMGIHIPNYIGNNERYMQKLKNYKEALLSINGVQSAAISSEVPGDPIDWSGSCRRTNQQESITVFKLTMDEYYLPMYENKFLAGRNFEKPTDSIYVIFNEAAIKSLEFENPDAAINQQVQLAGIDTLRILGVIEDFHQVSLANPISPTAYLFIEQERKNISVELSNVSQTVFLEKARAAFDGLFPSSSFLYFEISDKVISNYTNEKSLLKLILLFSGLAILIAILGLVGLVFYQIEQMKKQISIRKILGSSLGNLYGLLTKNTASQILTANIISIPMIYYFSTSWLETFAYRVSFPWISVFTAFTSLLLISLVSISHLILKVMRENPIKYLRNE